MAFSRKHPEPEEQPERFESEAPPPEPAAKEGPAYAVGDYAWVSDPFIFMPGQHCGRVTRVFTPEDGGGYYLHFTREDGSQDAIHLTEDRLTKIESPAPAARGKAAKEESADFPRENDTKPHRRK